MSIDLNKPKHKVSLYHQHRAKTCISSEHAPNNNISTRKLEGQTGKGGGAGGGEYTFRRPLSRRDRVADTTTRRTAGWL